MANFCTQAPEVAPLLSRTTAQTFEVTNLGMYNGMYVVIEITDLEAGTPVLTPTINMVDAYDGTTVLSTITNAAISTVATQITQVDQSLTTGALILGEPVTYRWQVAIAVADAQACTYRISANYYNAVQ